MLKDRQGDVIMFCAQEIYIEYLEREEHSNIQPG